MALKDIFTMIKADKYTADGREELIKAQEAEVEDKTYQIGEISQKTGLLKTANGWVKPKNGKAPGAKKDSSGADVWNNKYYKDDVRTEEGEKKILSETKTEVLESKVKDLENLKQKNGGKLGVQGEKSLQLAKAELESRKSKTPENKPADEKAKMEDVRKQLLELEKQRRSYKDDTAENYAGHNIRLKQAALLQQAGFNGRSDFDKYLRKKMPTDSADKPAEAPKTEKKPTLKLPDEKSSFSTDVNRMKKLKKEDYKQYTIQLEKLHSKYPINKWKDLYNKTTTDSAPRVLTGDCKVRIRKA